MKLQDDHKTVGNDLEFSIDRIPLEGEDFQHTFPVSWVTELLIPGYTAATTSLTVDGRIRRSGHNFIVESTFSGQLKGECIRCLVDFDAAISGGFTHVFDPFAPESDEIEDANDAGGISRVVEERIRLEPIVAEEFVLLIPAYPLCGEQCAGLCVDCGTNLNEGSCDCEPAMDPRWAKLTSLKLD